jgi:DNA-binding NtrC family response regulator
MRVLVVEDHEPTRRLMRRMLLELEGVIVDEASTAAEALSALAANSPELMLLDVRLGSGAETGGLEVLRDARALGCKARAVMVTGDLGSVREAMRLGASDYVLKGELSIDVLSAIVAEVQRHSLRPPPPTDDRRRARSLLGRSHGIERLRRLITQIAQAHAPVLVYGETGSGKELVARALHEEGSHADEPFVAINCSAIPASLFESVLFGHERGAFTGAERRTRGQLLVAAHGTVLLDEIAEMPLDIQAKLLRVLEERTVLPLGAEREIPFSARVVAATHVDLAERVEKGLFRRDLYYRLNVLYIDVPPLASRVEDRRSDRSSSRRTRSTGWRHDRGPATCAS